MSGMANNHAAMAGVVAIAIGTAALLYLWLSDDKDKHTSSGGGSGGSVGAGVPSGKAIQTALGNCVPS